ncbi:MAG: hypothetical protein ACK4YD_04935, partial [Chitinophagia bacterium]
MNNFKQNWIIYAIVIGLFLVITSETIDAINAPKKEIPAIANEGWMAPSLYTDRTLEGEERELVIYGEDL